MSPTAIEQDAAAAGHSPTQTLVARARAKNAAFMRGDMKRWASLVRMAPDFSLMQPFGGAASHGFDTRPQHLDGLSRYFQNGQTELELVQTCATADLIVLVMIERQTAEVGGLPAQDWSLRVTEVYRRVDDEWEFVHRHADPLVHKLSLEQAAALARGEPAAAQR